jgi:hypothetical protein
MPSKLTQLSAIVTPLDAAHGGLGFLAVANSWWLDFLNPIVQIGVTLGGVVYLYYMVRAKRMEWKLARLEYARKKAE